MAHSVARWVALGALFLVPFTPLIVADPFFFPFITGKAFYFRTLVEIAVCMWIVLAFLDRDYRPRFSWIGAVAIAFVAWMLIADSFAINATKAFWSNFERMEGWVLLIHLLGFFFAASAVLRVEKRWNAWRAWFLTSLGVSVIICGYALLQIMGAAAIHQGSTRIDASLGNSAYLAIYLLFNTFIALWLAFSEKRVWLKWSLVALAVLEAGLIFFTGTRGAVIGLVLGLVIASLLTALTAGKRARRVAADALVLLVLLIGGFYLARNTAFIQNNFLLQRFASISLRDGQTRFTLWNMALKGVQERPLVGWGQEGFNNIFNKYYDPSLYTQEQWFDRAHNAFIDWLTAGGIPAFLLYLALFVSAGVLLWRSPELSRSERVMLTAALIGYACHNLFVFDNLYSYVYFFALLALIDSQTARRITTLESAPVLSTSDGVTYALPVAAVTALALIWFVNITGIQVNTKLVEALSARRGVEPALLVFQDLAARPGFAAQEVREQLVRFAQSATQSSGVSQENKERIVTLAIQEMKKQVEEYPTDTRGHMQLSYAYRAAGDRVNALKEIEAALALSPNKESILIDKGIFEWDSGDLTAAQADFSAAYRLGPQFQELAAYAAAGALAVGNRVEANRILLDAFGTTTVDNQILAIAYFRIKDWPSSIRLWKLRAAQPGASPQTYFTLAQMYYYSGDSAQAIRTIRTAMQLFSSDESVQASGEDIIAQIQGRK